MKYTIRVLAVQGHLREEIATYTRTKRTTIEKIILNVLKSQRGSGDYDIVIEQRETEED